MPITRLLKKVANIGGDVLDEAKKYGPRVAASLLPGGMLAEQGAEKLVGLAAKYPEHAIAAATGAGFGAIAGAPAGGVGAIPGAIIGAGTALATSIAGPKVARALPEGTPQPVRTATEYGIYGLGFGGGAASAGTKGATRVVERLAVRQGVKLAVASGISAAGGEEAARIAGAPPEIGALLGAIGGPLAGPAAFRKIRSTLYNSSNDAAQRIAESIGATEANSVKRARIAMPMEVPLGSLQNTVDSIDRSVYYAELRLREHHGATLNEQTGAWEFKGKMSPEDWQASTGGYSEEHLKARARGQLPPDLRQAYTPEFQKARNQLPRMRGRYQSSIDAEHAARSELETALQSVPEAGYGGRLIPQKNHYLWESVDGVQKAIPDEQGKIIHEGQKKIDRAVKARDSQFRAMQQHLGVQGELPATEAEQVLAIRDKFIPNFEQLANGKELLDPEEAQQLLRVGRSAQTEKFVEKAASIAREEDKIKSLNMFKEALARDPSLGIPAPDMLQKAAHRYAEFVAADEMWTRNPNGISHLPKESVQSFSDYMRYVGNIAQAEPSRNVGTKLRDLIQNPRGQVHLKTGDGVVARELLDLIPPAGTDANKAVVLLASTGDTTGWQAVVRAPFETTEAAAHVPLDQLVVRYSKNQLAQVSADMAQARQNLSLSMTPQAITARFKGIPKPTVTAEERMFGTRAQMDAAQAGWQKQVDMGTAFANDPALTPMQRQRAAQRVAALTEQGPPSGAILQEKRDQLWNDFKNYMNPAETSVDYGNITPELQQRIADGKTAILLRSPRPGSSPEEIESFLLNRQILLQSPKDKRVLFSVDDPAALEVLGIGNMEQASSLERRAGITERQHVEDPMYPVWLNAATTNRDYANMVHNDVVNVPGSLPNWLEKNLIGESVIHPGLRAIGFDYFGGVEAAANHVAGTYAHTVNEFQRAAAAFMKVPVGAKDQLKAGVEAALGEGAHPMRAMTAFTKELHPLSHADAWRELAMQHLDITKLPFHDEIVQFEKDFPEYAGQAKNWLAGQVRMFYQYPEAFGELEHHPTFSYLRNKIAFYDNDLVAASAVFGTTGQTQARRWYMQAMPTLRDAINTERLGAANASPITLLDELAKATRGIDGKAPPFSELVVHGAEADMAYPMGAHQSMLMGEMFDKIKKLAKPGESVGSKDLLFKGSAWEIRNLNKWPEELHDSLRGLNDIIGGQHKWQGVQQMSQQIAMGMLAADLSVLGIQGYKFVAHTLLAGHPLRAVEYMRKGMTHIMSDFGYYSWLKQDLEEVTYYASRGLSGGVKAVIAGPEIRKLPLENIPLIGRAFTGIREGTDLQFNRMLHYWKVQAVREGVEFHNNMKAMGSEFHQNFLSSTPKGVGVNSVVEDMGGIDNYLLASHENIVDATIRQVNRSMGGVNMSAEGIGMTRQAIEQVMLIVPGFFRAQAGQWAAAITKPMTPEGQTAITMLAREYLFAGMVSTGFARLMGTEDRINFSDPTQATWLATPIPDALGGGHMTVLPTMGLPRLASRVLKNIGESAQQGKVPDPTFAIQQFSRARLSPMLGAAANIVSGEDYFGRKYEGDLDKWGSNLAQITLPIVMSSAISDLREGIRQNSSTGHIDWEQMATNTGIQILGKNSVPEAPLRVLDNLSKSNIGTDYNLLTDAEKVQMRQNPAFVAAEAEANFFSSRRNGPSENFVDREYKMYGLNIDKLWQQPMAINGKTTKQEDDDLLLDGGQMTGDEWRARYQRRQESASQMYDTLRQHLEAEGINPDEIRATKMERLSKGRAPGDFAWLVQQARTEYSAVELPSDERTVTTPDGGVITIGQANFDQFRLDRESVLSRYPAAVRDAVLSQTRANDTPGIAAYRKASAEQQLIESMPRYRGLTVEQGQAVDAMLGVFSKTAEDVRSQTGLPQGASLGGLSQMIRQIAVQEMASKGLIRSNDDMRLAGFATLMATDQAFAYQMMNRVQVEQILKSPEAVVYYPYLRHRVPKELQSQLPRNVFTAPVAAAQQRLAQ